MITLDGYKLFPLMAENRELFAPAESQIHAAAERAVLAVLADGSLDLARAKALKRVIGAQSFGAALDALAAAKLKAVIKHIDPGVKWSSSDEHGMRRHIQALVDGAVEPKPVEAGGRKGSGKGGGKTKAAKPAAPEARGLSSSMTARPGGR